MILITSYVVDNTDQPHDCEGSSLMVGDLVVYNFSGELQRDNIVKITRARKPYNSDYNFVYHMKGGSVVRNRRGIYRLRDYDKGGPPR